MGRFGSGFDTVTQRCSYSPGSVPAQTWMGWCEILTAVLSDSGARLTDDGLGGSRRHEQREQSVAVRRVLGVKCERGKQERE
jgi:hypothetical protein